MRPIPSLLAVAFSAGVILSAAAPSPLLPYQGRLLESSMPVTGTRTFTFSILSSSDTSLWASGNLNLTISNGIYSVTLGAIGQPAIPTSLLAQSGLKLRVTVGGQTLSPDVDLVPALQARSAWEAQSAVAVTGAFGGDVIGTQAAISVNKLKGADLVTDSAAAGQVLMYSAAGKWQATNPPVGISSVTAEAPLSVTDGTTTPKLSLTGTIPPARLPAFTGDVTSSIGSNALTVTRLQGVPVASTSPTNSQVLAYVGSQWTPTTISGSGSGTVTSITAGTGLTTGGNGTMGGTITTSGTLQLSDSGVTANSYTNPTITVDRYGRVTYAANGGGASNVAVSAGNYTLQTNDRYVVMTSAGTTLTLSAPSNGRVVTVLYSATQGPWTIGCVTANVIKPAVDGFTTVNSITLDPASNWNMGTVLCVSDGTHWFVH